MIEEAAGTRLFEAKKVCLVLIGRKCSHGLVVTPLLALTLTYSPFTLNECTDGRTEDH